LNDAAFGINELSIHLDSTIDSRCKRGAIEKSARLIDSLKELLALQGAPVSEGVDRDDVFSRPQTWSFEHHGDRCFYHDVFSHANGDESLELAKALKRHGLVRPASGYGRR
jgi:hypothetical protein